MTLGRDYGRRGNLGAFGGADDCARGATTLGAGIVLATMSWGVNGGHYRVVDAEGPCDANGAFHFSRLNHGAVGVVNGELRVEERKGILKESVLQEVAKAVFG